MVAVVATVKNEEASIARLLDSLLAQTRRPDEIVICDGGSTDRTVALIQGYIARGAPVRLLEAPGANISTGRNRAIAATRSDLIAVTDAGVRLSPTWLARIIAPLEQDPTVDVVSGFFRSAPESLFELALGATTLPDVDEIDPARFLPSSRSVAFRRRAWQQVGGYPEWLDYCEDLVFDLALRRAGCRFVFVPEAVVDYRPRSSLRAFFRQYYLYARGDGKAGLWTHRHALRYGTYLVGAPLVLLTGLWYKVAWLVLGAAALGYVYRPYRRLFRRLGPLGWRERLLAVLLVPLLRLTGDVAKMLGYPVGCWWRWRRR